MLTEPIELLGKGLYKGKNIPDVLTLKSIPTATELDYVGADNFDRTMIDKILPKSVEENIPFGDLLAIDYYWILRCLRILSYGPYHTTNSIFCADCREVTYGEARVDLRTVNCNPVPEGFDNQVRLTSDDFLDFDKDIVISLLTINEQLAKEEDKMFADSAGTMNRNLATVCYSIKKVDNIPVTPLDNKTMIERQMSAADYCILKEMVHDKLNFGLQSGGRTICPKCKSPNGAFMALIDDRFFRPTVGDLKQWKSDRKDRRQGEDVSGSKTSNIRKHS